MVFDLDGVLVESEGAWNVARQDITLHNGGRWPPEAQRAMMGMSSREWSSYMHDELGVAMPPAQISDSVVARLAALYRDELPLIEGAREAVVKLARVWPLASRHRRTGPSLTWCSSWLTWTTALSCRSPRRKWHMASQRPTSTSRQHAGSAYWHPAAQP